MRSAPVPPPRPSGWAGVDWAVVTRTGIVQARCGHPYGAPSRPCHAWRLSSPDGSSWRPCFTCGSGEVPVAVQAAGPDRVAAAIAAARRPAADGG